MYESNLHQSALYITFWNNFSLCMYEPTISTPSPFFAHDCDGLDCFTALYAIGGHGGIETVGGHWFCQESCMGSKIMSFRLKTNQKRGREPWPMREEVSQINIIWAGKQGDGLFHNCNVFEPTCSVQNAWRLFIHHCYTSSTTDNTDLLISHFDSSGHMGCGQW